MTPMMATIAFAVHTSLLSWFRIEPWEYIIHARAIRIHGAKRYECYVTLFFFLVISFCVPIASPICETMSGKRLLRANDLLPSLRLEVFLARVKKLVVIPAHKVLRGGVCSYAQDIKRSLLPRVPSFEQLLTREIDFVHFLPSNLLVNIRILIERPIEKLWINLLFRKPSRDGGHTSFHRKYAGATAPCRGRCAQESLHVRRSGQCQPYQ